MSSNSSMCTPERSLFVRALCSAVSALALVAACAMPASAQTQDGAAAAGKSKARAADAGGSAVLQKRVEQLEEQLVDMQVTIGTLESLARSGGSAGGGRGAAPLATGGGLGANDAARLEGMETQIRALSSEVQRLNNQVRQLGGGGDRGDTGGLRPSYAERSAPTTTNIPSSFGSTTVTSGGGSDPIGSLIDAQPLPPGAAQFSMGGTQMAALPPAESNANVKQDYDTAYGHLLRQDYGAAEAAFDDFIKAYPNDPRAGDAQYWLGETYFVRGNYKSAASSFLKGYQTYSKSNKAPDSLLKLAMSLDRLGQKDAACSSFGELVTRFPDAPGHVKSKAASEQKRLACR